MAAKAARDVKLWSPVVEWEERPNGEFVVWREDPLGPYPDKINERLVHWANEAPHRTWMADREGMGAWRRVSFSQALDAVRRIGQFLLDLKLSPENPLVILSENSIEHALMALGAQHVGIPSAAIAPVDTAFGSEIPFAALRNLPNDRANIYLFDDILKTEPTAEADEAYDAVGPDTVAKFLFTSGTTGSPKAVIQTQRMLCSNQEMVADCYSYFRDEPPVLVDWAPWNHTASGNKCFNIAIYNGGTYYIDRGKPSPALIGQTIANLREISPTWYFNVPAGFEMLIQAMRDDESLRKNFFKDLKLLMYAGAGMAQHTWDALLELSEQTIGERVPLGTGIGSTETAPFAIFCTDPQDKPGNIGVPGQGVIMKLVPIDDKFELRLKGPNVTPGYWRNEKLTKEAFDDEGFYRIGDAVKFAVPGDPRQGFYFDGRTAENFKLQTGTWVAVGVLRAQLVNQFGGLIRDAVIAGENRAELGALGVPFIPALRELVGGGEGLSDRDIIAHPKVRAAIAERLKEHQKQASGSATRVMRMTEPLRFEKGEVTDKGSINQRAVLRERADLIDALYTDADVVITVAKELAA
jgi:feruloyl-CoA synthase